MSMGSNETVADIVAEMREFADTDSQTIGRDVLRRRIQHFARRIEQSVTDCNQFGNAAAMRKALEEVRFYLPHFLQYMRLHREDAEAGGYYERILELVDAALPAHPRNCDVGTAEDQIKRHREWCKRDKCLPGIPCSVCFAKWSQMPYEEGNDE